jgi:GTP-binding protein
MLRESDCHTVVAANKADNPERDRAAAEFERFGFPVFPVSALHNRGFGPMMDAVLEALPAVAEESEAHPLRVVIVGRPNVGKSSYLNRLLRDERVIVSEVPGTTRDSIDIPFVVGKGQQARHYMLTDTAGLRRGTKVKTAVETFSLLRAEQSIQRADIAVVVLDAVQGPTAQDKKIASFVLKAEKGCVILVNKWDLATVTQRKLVPEIRRIVPFVGHCPIVFVSAETGYNIRRSVDAIDHVAAQIRAVLPTSTLNRTLLEAYGRVHPPVVKGKPLKIFYATQVGQAPVRVRVFVNDPRRVKKPYRDYLVRSLRENFGLEGAPVVLQFRARRAAGGR